MNERGCKTFLFGTVILPRKLFIYERTRTLALCTIQKEIYNKKATKKKQQTYQTTLTVTSSSIISWVFGRRSGRRRRALDLCLYFKYSFSFSYKINAEHLFYNSFAIVFGLLYVLYNFSFYEVPRVSIVNLSTIAYEATYIFINNKIRVGTTIHLASHCPH